jgi:acetate kinase
MRFDSSPDRERKICHVEPILEHTSAIKVVTNILVQPEHGVIQDVKEIDAVGHRVVHGGEKFNQSTLITQEIKMS